MEKKQLLLKRLNEIGESLERSGKALALMGLGSVGIERDRLDQYSDLDFFAIVKAGYKQKFLEDLSWLSEIAPLTFVFRNTRDGFKVLYEDDIFCEFAVFEFDELKDISYNDFQIIWNEKSFDCSQISARNIPQIQKNNQEFMIGEALTNLYIGLGRDQRGEKWSAHQFIQNFALNHVLHLCESLYEEQSPFKDVFVIERRIEQRFPEVKELLPMFVQGYEKNRESAKAILEFLDANFEINARMKERLLNMIL